MKSQRLSKGMLAYSKTSLEGKVLYRNPPRSGAKDKNRAQRPPWTPSFSIAVRLLLLIRVSGAMYSNINDCDEGTALFHIVELPLTFLSDLVFNFWEPLHFLDQGYAFQTWELSPKFALRSWAYILLHWIPARMGKFFVAGDKVCRSQSQEIEFADNPSSVRHFLLFV